MKAHYSAKKQDWETPQDLFDKLDFKYGFTLDVCANKDNAKCDRYFSPEVDGLSQSWAGETCWMNPPYGKEIPKWAAKALEESLNPNTIIVALLPARTDTRWFHNHVLHKATIFLIKGRIRFQGASHNAPFPNMIAVWHPNMARIVMHWE